MATLRELETALVNAHNAGDSNAARKLAAFITEARKDPSNQIPDMPVLGTEIPEPKPSIADKIIGAGEAGLTMLTGMTGGTLGMVGGTGGGMAAAILSGEFGTPEAAQMVKESAEEGAAKLTYAPRTQSGQEQAQVVGQAASQLIPLMPFGQEIGMAAQAARVGTPVALAQAAKAAEPIIAQAKKVSEPVIAKAKDVAGKVKETFAPKEPEPTGAAPSGGAAGVDIAQVRQDIASGLPVPIKLTEGQKTREFGQQQFERETFKNPELGAPIRERFAEQNLQLQQNLDAFIDDTGTTAFTPRELGETVTQALRDRVAKDKTKIRALYKDAEKAGELETPVNLSPLSKYLNENRAERGDNSIMTKVGRQLDVLEVATGDFKNGSLQLGDMTLKQAENVRKFINRNTDKMDSNDIRIATELKSIIDQSTDGKGGKIYGAARQARMQLAKNFENVALIKDLLGYKRGTTDRAIALEDVLRRSILDPSTSLDTMKHLRRVLQNEGDNGKQAWRDLQGGTLQYIKDQATKNVARDQAGNPIVSPAQLDKVITGLDKSGKLEFLFTPSGAEKLRMLNDLSKDILTSPPGSVNASNTASILLASMDMVISGSAGVPAPVLSGLRILMKNIKDKKIKVRVQKALGNIPPESNP